ncbi:MAG: L-seryl-tRNA(Sec) selenium transferase [Candidatus Marinimicrobia bacterium]|jgi:L-seryl-tRNA(Ser) seleniumtransferase|nr:L-seryl-tRNA(Sec) selenium transferase [Candidatus Neomarinimicrobiota bacterium]MDP6726235.1 L-seryl-tRNA(Sec) selenium transferase [Candidatus Neomarinimicrobiota bacterium]|tara:strand:- start:43103 stop:44473 length:1371 start_codon:yes stop_codon:yes gene_type:complete
MSLNQLKQLPSVSEVLLEVRKDTKLHNDYITKIITTEISQYRADAKAGKLKINRKEIVDSILGEIYRLAEPSMKNIINGTGVVLHTGFGRAPISKKVISNATKKLEGYVNLEFDLDSGKRGERQDHINNLLSAICGSESSLMVNNNAAAVLIALNTCAEGKEVIVSRGQEVEIGGSFRIPDVVRKSYCNLVEVGTTNRTHLKDYEKAITKNTGTILWAHTSNYVVQGFTKEVSLTELAELAKKKRIPLVADLGSGALADMAKMGLPPEELVEEVVKTGADIITFSGDKLLGGPQSGLIVGKKKFVNKIHKNPLYRTYRCDKWTIVLMEETLRTYASDEKVSGDNLSLKLLTTSQNTLLKRGEKMLTDIPKKKIKDLGISLVESKVEAGSGSLPVEAIPSAALQFKPNVMSVSKLAKAFRTGNIPVVGYTKGNTFYIDLKAVLPNQVSRLIQVIQDV